jgi:hypothetical protein
MAATYVGHQKNAFAATNVQTLTTAAFAVSAGQFLVASEMADRGGSPLYPATISDNSAGKLTWTKQAEVNVSASFRYTVIWTAPVTQAIASLTVSSSKGDNTTSVNRYFDVSIYSGVTGVGGTGTMYGGSSGSTPHTAGAPLVTFTTTGSNSIIVAYKADNTGNTTSDVPADNTNTTGGVANPTLIINQSSLFSYDDEGWYWPDSGAPGSKTVGNTDLGSDYAISAVELLGAAAAPPSHPYWGRVKI